MTRRLVGAAGLVLIIAVVFRWWLSPDLAPDLPVSQPDTRFNYTLTDFRYARYDQTGRRELAVSGPRLEHDPAQRKALIEAPRFELTANGSRWRGSAQLGQLLRNSDILVLDGAVRLDQLDDPEPVSVRTESLQHDRLARTIETDQPVEIRRPGITLEAGGLTMVLDNQTMELSNGVYIQAEVVGDRDTGRLPGSEPGRPRPGGR